MPGTWHQASGSCIPQYAAHLSDAVAATCMIPGTTRPIAGDRESSHHRHGRHQMPLPAIHPAQSCQPKVVQFSSLSIEGESVPQSIRVGPHVDDRQPILPLALPGKIHVQPPRVLGWQRGDNKAIIVEQPRTGSRRLNEHYKNEYRFFLSVVISVISCRFLIDRKLVSIK